MHPLFLHYPIHTPSKQVAEHPYPTYTDNEYHYFIIPVTFSEEEAWEKYFIAKHFHEYDVANVLCPIQNVHNQFITSIGKETFMLYYARESELHQMSIGKQLAIIHRIGQLFPYKVESINNYGNWKELWIQKVDQYEQLFKTYYQHKPTPPFMRELVDYFPYIIGISENAIQYMNLVMKERNYNEFDQPVLAYARLSNQLQEPYIWTHRLIYDHPARDIAEYLRPMLCEQDGINHPTIQAFLKDYLSICQPSPFSWKMVFARLLFPIHLYDAMDECVRLNYSDTPLGKIEEMQIHYEKNLQTFFYQIGIDISKESVIQLDWLMN